MFTRYLHQVGTNGLIHCQSFVLFTTFYAVSAEHLQELIGVFFHAERDDPSIEVRDFSSYGFYWGSGYQMHFVRFLDEEGRDCSKELEKFPRLLWRHPEHNLSTDESQVDMTLGRLNGHTVQPSYRRTHPYFSLEKARPPVIDDEKIGTPVPGLMTAGV